VVEQAPYTRAWRPERNGPFQTHAERLGFRRLHGAAFGVGPSTKYNFGTVGFRTGAESCDRSARVGRLDRLSVAPGSRGAPPALHPTGRQGCRLASEALIFHRAVLTLGTQERGAYPGKVPQRCAAGVSAGFASSGALDGSRNRTLRPPSRRPVFGRRPRTNRRRARPTILLRWPPLCALQRRQLS
jgi:hypothetical protein